MQQIMANGSFGNCTFLVTPGKMYSTSDQVLKRINATKATLNNMSKTVKASVHYWDGDVGDTRRESLIKLEDKTQEIFKRLLEHVSELKTMAEVYVQTESMASEFAQGLPTNVVF